MFKVKKASEVWYLLLIREVLTANIASSELDWVEKYFNTVWRRSLATHRHFVVAHAGDP